MLTTEPQKQHQLLEEKALQGEPIVLEVGYEEAYQAWALENAAILHTLSPEDRAQSFSDYMEKIVFEKERALIEEQESDPTRRKEKLTAAQRGDLLLVSTDEGQHFDKVMTVEEVEKVELSKVRLLSSTLRSTTPNFTEVKEEQNLIHVVAKLRENHFLVEQAEVKDHKVQLVATHPRQGKYEVTVPLNQDATLPLVYEFINAEGKKKVSETQLPEEYGEAVAEHTLGMQDQETMAQLHLLQNQQEAKKDQESQALKIAMATILPHALNQPYSPVAALLKAKSLAEKTRLQMMSPVIHQNNVAAQAAVKAHKARHDKDMKEEIDRIAERKEKHQVASKLAYEKNQEEELEKKKKTQDLAAKMRRTMAVGTGAAAGIFAGAGSLSFFLIHLSHS